VASGNARENIMVYHSMGYDFTNAELVFGVLLFIFAALCIATWLDRWRTRTLALRTGFGSEYDRTASHHDSTRDAGAELAED